MTDCIFCKIVKGEIPCHKIWEDENYIAFLDINPEVYGMTLVVPKEHITSYFIDVEREVLADLIEKTKEVVRIMDSKLPNIYRTRLVFEGLDVDHLHAKLYPMYKRGEEPQVDKSPEALAKLAEALRQT